MSLCFAKIDGCLFFIYTEKKHPSIDHCNQNRIFHCSLSRGGVVGNKRRARNNLGACSVPSIIPPRAHKRSEVCRFSLQPEKKEEKKKARFHLLVEQFVSLMRCHPSSNPPPPATHTRCLSIFLPSFRCVFF